MPIRRGQSNKALHSPRVKLGLCTYLIEIRLAPFWKLFQILITNNNNSTIPTNKTNNMDTNDVLHSYFQPYVEDIDLLWDDLFEVIDDDDQDEEDMMFVDDSTLPSERRKKYKYDRIDWKQELEAASPFQFHYRYHMSQAAIDKLVELLGDMINVNKAKADHPQTIVIQ
jgi:hypothetical protein